MATATTHFDNFEAAGAANQALSEQAQYSMMDLFSGCGGMTLGFAWDSLFGDQLSSRSVHESPFKPVFANDFNCDALATYRKNFDPEGTHSVCAPIEAVLTDNSIVFPRADVVVGGPPCQGFSLLNKQRLGDERRELWWHFIEVASRVDAKVIVMENVPQLLGTAEFEAILARLKQLGFRHLMAHKLCAANYGVPQVRHRAFIMASRIGPIALPLPSHLAPDKLSSADEIFSPPARLLPWVNVRESIGDLNEPVGTEIRTGDSAVDRLHFGRKPTAISLERYKLVPPGGNRFDLQARNKDLTPGCWIRKTSGGTDLFGRLWWDRPSVTIRTEFFKPEKGRYLHPDKHRPITHREAARLQTFPDHFEFVGSKVEVAKQIGNAVPPLLAFAVARRVEECLAGLTTVEDMQNTRETFSLMLKEKVTEMWIG